MCIFRADGFVLCFVLCCAGCWCMVWFFFIFFFLFISCYIKVLSSLLGHWVEFTLFFTLFMFYQCHVCVVECFWWECVWRSLRCRREFFLVCVVWCILDCVLLASLVLVLCVISFIFVFSVFIDSVFYLRGWRFCLVNLCSLCIRP